MAVPVSEALPSSSRARLNLRSVWRMPLEEILVVDAAGPADLDRHALGQGVDDGGADSVQSAGDRVGLAAELAAGVERGHDGFDAGDAGGGVLVNGDAASVVHDANGAVFVQGDLDAGAEPRHELVNGVVNDFVYQVVESALVGAADIHTGPTADGFHAFQDLDICGGVLVFGSRGHRNSCLRTCSRRRDGLPAGGRRAPPHG